jgi:hypothetical protein
MHTRAAWNDYFTGSPTLLQSKEYVINQTLSDEGVYILNCLFKFTTSTNNGGALSCTSVVYMLIESSSFFSCTTSGNRGGAIHFSYVESQCVLYAVCAFGCYSTYTDYTSHQFSYIQVKSNTSNKNYINYSSISQCVNENPKSRYTFCHDFGKVCFSSINSSLNKCGFYSGVCLCPSKDSSSITSSMLYSTFADNTTYNYTCIWFNMGGANYEIKYCNIIRNTQVSSSYGTIYPHGNLIIEDSCILENNATVIFYLSSPTYTITISNCTVDKTTNNGNMTIQNTATKSFIHALNHMSTRNCASEYDSAGYLTAIPANKLFCYTFKMNQCQVRISDFFSLNWVFMFAFIHTNSY